MRNATPEGHGTGVASDWDHSRGGILALALAVVLTACGDGDTDAPGGLAPFPPPPPAHVGTTVLTDFAGSEACAECHTDQYTTWARSTHGRAGGIPGPDLLIAPFNGEPIRFADAVVIPQMRGDAYEFVVRQDGHPEAVYGVDGVIGGGHMIGGGTQGFISLQADGTERFLPWDWSRHESLWFCNTGSRLNRGWLPITPDVRLADCGDWPPLRPMGTVERFANCQECHGSQIHTVLEPGEGYRTEYTTLQVNCESCHGPARRHVELMGARDDAAPTGAAANGTVAGTSAAGTSAAVAPAAGDIGLASLAYLSKDESLGVCFACHALKDVLQEGYLPGEPLEQYYALKFPVLGDQPYFADGRVRSFAYQANHLASACYLRGPMDCVSCHEPHGQGYWDTDRRPLASPFDDGQCTSCHPSKAVDIESHTFHPAASEGSRCVSCHMPYLQHPEVGPDIAFARSDHTIALPRPVFDADLGLVSACAGCHEDRSSLQLQGEARAWWGELKPHRPAVQGQVDELRARNVGEAAQALLHPQTADPLVQFQALSRLLTAYLSPDDATLPDAVVAELTALAATDDLDLRALALASLHWVRGDDPSVRGTLVDALTTAQSDGALRGRWLLALGFLGDEARDSDDAERAAAAYRKALEISPDDARVLAARGLLHGRTGNLTEAIRDLQRSVALDPAHPLTWINLGNQRFANGSVAGAREAYREALALNPREALAHFNLGNTYRQADDLDAALAAYLQAVEADPGLGIAHFEIARAYILLERPAEALPFARRAVEFRPNHPGSRAMLGDLESALGGA